ncbi:MAG: hypothetical protein HQL30_12560, partial [Candidatus Omnitrophica bacterium]|nr:hypothetical protein [Candidatus Omnitrophota bacterium]
IHRGAWQYGSGGAVYTEAMFHPDPAQMIFEGELTRMLEAQLASLRSDERQIATAILQDDSGREPDIIDSELADTLQASLPAIWAVRRTLQAAVAPVVGERQLRSGARMAANRAIAGREAVRRRVERTARLEVPEGYRDILVIGEERGQGFGNIVGALNLCAQFQRLAPAAETRVSIAFPGLVNREEEENFAELLRNLNAKGAAEGLPEIKWLKANYAYAKADVVVHYGGDKKDLDWTTMLHSPPKIDIHIPIYAQAWRGGLTGGRRWSRESLDGEPHVYLPTLYLGKKNVGLIFDPSMAEESLRLRRLGYAKLMEERRAALSALGFDYIFDEIKDDVWAFCYAHNKRSIKRYLERVKASGKRVTVFLVAGSWISDRDSFLMKMEKICGGPRSKVRLISLPSTLRYKEQYDRLLLLSGAIVDGRLMGAFPLLLTGDHSISAAIAALKVFITDGMNAAGESRGFIIWRKFLEQTARSFLRKYAPDLYVNHNRFLGRNGAAALFNADARQLQKDWDRVARKAFREHSIADEVLNVIRRDASAERRRGARMAEAPRNRIAGVLEKAGAYRRSALAAVVAAVIMPLNILFVGEIVLVAFTEGIFRISHLLFPHGVDLSGGRPLWTHETAGMLMRAGGSMAVWALARGLDEGLRKKAGNYVGRIMTVFNVLFYYCTFGHFGTYPKLFGGCMMLSGYGGDERELTLFQPESPRDVFRAIAELAEWHEGHKSLFRNVRLIKLETFNPVLA